jgi:hypothetical protein
MSVLRLPLIGDFIYVARLETPDAEQKYVVTGETDDGYHMAPEGMDPTNDVSMVKYRFKSKKWVVHLAENEFNVRIELNPELYDSIFLLDSDIQHSIEKGRFVEAKENSDRLLSISDINVVTSRDAPNDEVDSPLYDDFMEKPNRIDIFEWLKKNYVVDYPRYLDRAIMFAIRDPDNYLDLFEWLLDQNVDWIKYSDRYYFCIIFDAISDNVIEDDYDDIFKVLMGIPGLIKVTEEKQKNNSYMEMAEYYKSTKILELLRAVPQKAVQVKHLQ